MKFLRLLLCAAALATFGSGSAQAKPGWLTDFKKAQEEAKTNKKLLLVDFTGSDWCGYCIKLDREVFSKSQFREYAEKNLILVEVDFPRGRELSPQERKQNFDLADRFGVQGYPTIVILDGEGKTLGMLGYDSGIPEDSDELKATPETFIANIEKLRKEKQPAS